MVKDPLLYAKQILDKNNTGKLSIPTLVADNWFVDGLLKTHFPKKNDTESVTEALIKLFNNRVNASDCISIENQIRPILVEAFNNKTDSNNIECIPKS